MQHYCLKNSILVLCLLLIITGCGYNASPTRPAPPKWVPPPPVMTGFVDSDPKKFVGGYSELTVDNSRNDHDVMVKFYRLDNPPEVSRIFTIQAGGTFLVKQIKVGTYDIRFRNLKTGNIQKTEPFVFEERRTATGVEYSGYSFTLYTVRSGNAKTQSIDESQF